MGQKRLRKNDKVKVASGRPFNTALRYSLIFLSAVAIVSVYHIQKEFFKPTLEQLFIRENYALEERDPEVTCNFPIVSPFHESILPHVKISTPVWCAGRGYLLTLVDESGILRFNLSAVREAGYSEFSLPSCYYKEISLKPMTDFEVEYGEEKEMTGLDQLNSDFVRVDCFGKLRILPIYQNFHASVQRNSSVRKFKDDMELGVAVIGIDSMSRLNFMRQLPLSFRFLVDDLDADVMLGFNKVGENTYPNVIPMLTGRPCAWGDENYYQHWPFAWSQFEQEGAATMYSEDLPHLNMFDYMSTGLLERPTMHYMRTYWLAVEDSLLYKTSSAYCLGPTPKHAIYFDYLLSFMRTYKDSPQFLFSLLNELSHDYVNTVGAIDRDFRDFLRTCAIEGLFNRTVVLVLGDHGNRIDPIRLTEVGRIEDRMPMVSVIMPPWTEKVYPGWRAALRTNSKRLLSSYDIHGTFMDLLSTLKRPGSEDNDRFFHYDTLRAKGLNERWSKHFSAKSKELTFFQPVPTGRDCTDAGIPDVFCVCQSEEGKLPKGDRRSLLAAEKVTEHFNSVILRGLLDKCETQKLDSVDSAYIFPLKNRPDDHRMLVSFRTQPGHGAFEANVEVSRQNGTEVWQVVGDVLRINHYGDQANCLSDALLGNNTILRGVCYCR